MKFLAKWMDLEGIILSEVTHYISGDLTAAFIRSAICLAPLSCDFDKTSRKISANVISLFSMIFKLQTFQ